MKHLGKSKIMMMSFLLLKEEIKYLKGELKEKNKVISNLIGFCKSSSRSLQDNSSPWLLVDTSNENIDFTLDTPLKCLNLNTPSHSMLKKQGPTQES